MLQRTNSHPPELVLLVAWGVGFIALAWLRSTQADLPQDMSAYAAAADTLKQGLDPYTEIFSSAWYKGFPYVYFPGLNPLTALLPLSIMSWVVALDTLLRGLFAALAVRFLANRFKVVDPAWPALLLGLIFMDSFVTDFFVGNLELYMFSIFLGLVALCRLPARLIVDGLVGFVAGLVLMIKPMWGIPAAYAAAVHRRWGIVAGLAAGSASVFASAFLFYSEQISTWRALVSNVRVFWTSFDLGTAEPLLVPVALAAWGVAGWRVRDRADAWLWACASLLAWPRLGFYSYVIALPFLFWILGRYGKKWALLAALPGSLILTFLFMEATVLRLAIVYIWMLGLSAIWLLTDPRVAPHKTLDTTESLH